MQRDLRNVSMNRDQLTEEVLEEIFSIYRDVLHSHYPTPRLTRVLKELDDEHLFKFTTGPRKIWQSSFVIKEQDGNLTFAFEYELQLQFASMEKDLQAMQQQFTEKVAQYQ